MTDVRIVNVSSLEGVWADWLLKSNGTLDESEELANVVKVALMTDALAGETEVLPDPDSTDRKGWWGDYEAESIWGGWPIGCKNWLLSRAKIADQNASEGSTVYRAEMYTRSALQPLIDQRMCSRIDVAATRVGIDRIDVSVTLYRGPQPEIVMQFQKLWVPKREEPKPRMSLAFEAYRHLIILPAELSLTANATLIQSQSQTVLIDISSAVRATTRLRANARLSAALSSSITARAALKSRTNNASLSAVSSLAARAQLASEIYTPTYYLLGF